MNRRTSKLLDQVANALIRGGETNPPKKGPANQVYNPARNLKRKLIAQWNKKPRNIRGAQRLGIIHTLVSMEVSNA